MPFSICSFSEQLASLPSRSRRVSLSRSVASHLSLICLCCLTALPIAAQLIPPIVASSRSLDAINIRITRQGPYPAAVTHKAAPFLLLISNRSGTLVDTYSLIQTPAPILSPITAITSLLDLHSDLTKQRDLQIIQPLPGSYELRFLSHPNWVVSITITAN